MHSKNTKVNDNLGSLTRTIGQLAAEYDPELGQSDPLIVNSADS